MPEREVAVLLGHTYAVRRVLFSPHAETLVASCRSAAAGRARRPGPRAGHVRLRLPRLVLLPPAQSPQPPCLPPSLCLSLPQPPCSPHAPCSYDMTVRLWDYAAPEDALVRVWDHHSEFAVGLDWSTLVEGLLAR